MSNPRIFDAEHYESINTARWTIVSGLLSEAKEPLNLRTAVDVGCGLGYFSGLLHSVGLDVTAVDGRPENTEEAARRNPQIKFHTVNAEDSALRMLGKFDLVFCFGLLYHLENPFLTIRHLQAMTGRLLLVEAVIFPGEEPAMGLVDEGASEDQGLNHIAFYPTESALVKMFYRVGFGFVYKFRGLPDHPGYKSANGLPRIRTMLAASHESVAAKLLERIPEPATPIRPWDAASVAASINSIGAAGRLTASFLRQKLGSVRRTFSPAKGRGGKGRA